MPESIEPGPIVSGPVPAQLIYSGYADADAPAHRGWLLGHFMREQWVTAETRTAAIILISGRFTVDLPDRSVVLDRPGAYVVFGGVGHSWETEEDSTTIGVRWPSVPGY